MQTIFAVKKQENKVTERLRILQKFFLVKKDKHATNTISAWNFLLVESGKNIFSLIFWKHGAVNEFYGAIDISYQIRGAEFPVMRGMEKPKLLHSGTCTSTSRRHVTLKSPLLLQFPYCELCDNDNKQSNYRLMNVLFCTRALLADFSKSPK